MTIALQSLYPLTCRKDHSKAQVITERPNVCYGDEISLKRQCFIIIEGEVIVVLRVGEMCEENVRFRKGEKFDLDKGVVYCLITGCEGAKYVVCDY